MWYVCSERSSLIQDHHCILHFEILTWSIFSPCYLLLSHEGKPFKLLSSNHLIEVVVFYQWQVFHNIFSPALRFYLILRSTALFLCVRLFKFITVTSLFRVWYYQLTGSTTYCTENYFSLLILLTILTPCLSSSTSSKYWINLVVLDSLKLQCVCIPSNILSGKSRVDLCFPTL